MMFRSKLYPRHLAGNFYKYVLTIKDIRCIMKKSGGDEMLSVKEFAELFGVSKRTVFRWIEKGEVNAVKICGTVRIPEDEVQRKKRGE